MIFISHRMDEISEIGDRITVMRSGETVATVRPGRGVGGRSGAADDRRRRADRACRRAGACASRARSCCAVDGFEVRAGELVGLAGLEGHGQDRFLKGLAAAAGDLGAYVPRERRAESLFESKSIVENFALPTYGRDTAGGVDPARAHAAAVRRRTSSGWASGWAGRRT